MDEIYYKAMHKDAHGNGVLLFFIRCFFPKKNLPNTYMCGK